MSLILALLLAADLELSVSLSHAAPESPGPRVSLAAAARITLVDGYLSSDSLSGEVGYRDLFRPGVGYRFEIGLLWKQTGGWELGPYVSFGFDRFSGSAETIYTGETIDPDDLEGISALAGFRGVLRQDGWFGDFRGALGAVKWSDVDAVFSLGGTTVPDVAFLDGVTRFAFELGARVGVEAGPAVFSLGLALSVVGGPSRGADMTDDVEPTVLLGLGVELAVELGF